MAAPTLPKGIKFEVGSEGYVCTFDSKARFKVVALTGAVVGEGTVLFDGRHWRVTESSSAADGAISGSIVHLIEARLDQQESDMRRVPPPPPSPSPRSE